MSNLSRDYLEACSLFEDLTPLERLTYARVLHGMGISPSDACIEGAHPYNPSNNSDLHGGESTYCSSIMRNVCSCDCHLTREEYLDLHKTPTNEQ